jgi:4a-hydroxytetrahydrobiopterin dehydratase
MLREEVEKRLSQLKGWKLLEGTLEKNYKFRDFKQAVEFINRVADVAETQNHHPDILLWSWNNLRLTITTHSIKGLSENDFILASSIDRIKLG